MGQASKAQRVVRRVQLAAAASLSIVGMSAALAAEPGAVDGLLQFPNVRVIAAPQAATVTPGAGQGGMRAYKDSSTSELRGPTTEEMTAASTSASASASNSARRAAVASDSTTGAPEVAATSGVGVTLDESSLQYSVVVRQADGSLSEVCVTGVDKADEIVHKQPVLKSATRKETLNVR